MRFAAALLALALVFVSHAFAATGPPSRLHFLSESAFSSAVPSSLPLGTSMASTPPASVSASTSITPTISVSTAPSSVKEVLGSLREIESSMLGEGSGPQLEMDSDKHYITILDDVTGGIGGTGGESRIGGEGGEGSGPQLEIDPDEGYRIGKISGGTGGTGGKGIEVGGRGGTGRAPVINILRRNRPLTGEL
ncbi:hypothetical protein B0H14DRAFT_3558892 [Mycena olivaceomarginata]|nr:hypothetical protein B0H14DRAFT_3558892 [Mycena olivaceomarginata]